MTSIRDELVNGSSCSDRYLWGATDSVCLEDVRNGTCLSIRSSELAGRSVLLSTQDQLAAALALIELDGVARRIVICPPDVPDQYLPSIVARGSIDAVVSDRNVSSDDALSIVPLRVQCGTCVTRTRDVRRATCETEWVLLTSGTTGAPKMLVHSVAGLTAAICRNLDRSSDIVWGTFYDIRRYGGLQIFLRAILGRGSFVLSGSAETAGTYLARLGVHGATHVSGTPSHWRRTLMSASARLIAPRYVRLSGEIADQAILDNLRACYSGAAVGHAYASTEAGVVFEVNDALEGFPAEYVGNHGGVEIKIVDDSIRVRSPRTALSYLGEEPTVSDDDGFVDTGDIVQQRGDRYYFLGRRSGTINVGGLKVHPEEVEAAINRHPAVRMSAVRSRKSAITGSLVVADVVLYAQDDGGVGAAAVRSEILTMCRQRLAAHKVPALIHFVPSIEVAPAGKVARSRHA